MRGNIDNEYNHFSKTRNPNCYQYIFHKNTATLMFLPDNLSKLFPCTNDNESLKDKFIIVITWLPITYCVFMALCLYQMKVVQASPSFTRIKKENEFFMPNLFPIDLLQMLKIIAELGSLNFQKIQPYPALRMLSCRTSHLRIHLINVHF